MAEPLRRPAARWPWRWRRERELSPSVPQADYAEQALLGAVLIQPLWLEQPVPGHGSLRGLPRLRDLRPEDFHSPSRAVAWRAIVGGFADPVALEYELRSSGQLCPDLTLILGWCDRIPTSHGAPGWARLVLDAARRRRLLSLCESTLVAIRAGIPTDDLVREVQSRLEAL